MRRSALLLAFILMAPARVMAGPAEDATDAALKAVANIMTDHQAFIAAQQEDAIIVDDFFPYIWKGAGSVQRWSDDERKLLRTKNITQPRITSGKPLRAFSEGGTAYIVIPITYDFLLHGKKASDKGTFTFVMQHVESGWKISSWSYNGGKWKL